MSAVAAIPAQQPDATSLKLVERTNSNVDQARAIKVISQETRIGAVAFLKGVKALRGEAEAHHRPVIDAAHKAHKEAVAALKRVDDPLVEAERIVKGQIGSYDMEQDRIRRDAERKAQEEARRKQEEEALAAAAAAKAAGATEAEAEAILEEEMTAPLVVASVPPQAPAEKQGVGTRFNYKVQVRDMAALVKFVADTPMFINLLAVNETALNALARSQKESFDVPGCRLVREPVVSVRS